VPGSCVGTRALRRLAAALLGTALVLLLAGNTAGALNLYQDIFVSLSARPLGMGATGVALGQPASVFYNPAGLTSVRRFTLMHNHSARHFPGSHAGKGTEWDQLDGDTQAIVVPLPLSTYAHGLTLSGEMGYDYRSHPASAAAAASPEAAGTLAYGYPREQYWGSESYDAIATSLGLPCSAGYALRRHFGRFTPDPADPAGQPWIRLGEGQQWGVLARVLPGLDYGRSELKLDYDYTMLPSRSGWPLPTSQGAPDLSARLQQSRHGWALRPCGWLTLASDRLSEHYRFRAPQGQSPSGPQAQQSASLHRGWELTLGGLGSLRGGNNNGRPTCGLSLNLLGADGGLKFNYAEADGLLPQIVGAGSGFESVHIYGFELPIL